MKGIRKTLQGLSHRFWADPFSDLQAAIAERGLTPPPKIVADGQFQRFSSNGNPRDKSGWYIAYSHPVPYAAYGCWRSGIKVSWSSIDDELMSSEDRESVQKQLRKANEIHQQMLAVRQAEAQKQALARWNNASTIGPESHPYLLQKEVQAYGLKIEDESLLIPITDSAGVMQSLQIISPRGEKRFLSGGKVKAGFHKIGPLTNPVIVCEGYATAATLHEATELCCVAAFSASNLAAVATSIRSVNAELQIVIAADDDWKTAKNPGLAAATQAAKSVNATVVSPTFPSQRSEKDTDFNDLKVKCGIAAVRQAIDHAVNEPRPNQDWPDPTDLTPPGGTPVKKFDWDLLPEKIRPWVFDSCRRMQGPPEYAAVSILVSIAALIGAKVVITPKARDKGWRVVPTIWGIVVGRPATMKSPLLNVGVKPLTDLQNAAEKQFNTEFKKWQNSEQIDPLEAGDRPKRKIYKLNDTSVESLAETLEDEQWGLLVFRDELVGLLHDMEKRGQEAARSFYLSAFDGDQSYSLKRVTRGYRHIPRLCLSILGGIQPGALASHVEKTVAGGIGDDGLLQRFSMAVWPDLSQKYEYVDQAPDKEAEAQFCAIYQRLSQLQAIDGEASVWSYSDAAQVAYKEWVTNFERELRTSEMPPAFVTHLSKYRKLVPALSLVFALIDTPDNNNIVELPELERAMAWSEFLRSHAMKIYSSGTPTPQYPAATLLTKLKGGVLQNKGAQASNFFTPREIVQKGWSGMKTTDELLPVLEILVHHGWLRKEVKPANHPQHLGRTSTRYWLHPELMQQG
jgi:putative DNA primase/helicase